MHDFQVNGQAKKMHMATTKIILGTYKAPQATEFYMKTARDETFLDVRVMTMEVSMMI